MESGARVQVPERAVLRRRELQPGDRRRRRPDRARRLPDRAVDLEGQDQRALRARQDPVDRPVLRRGGTALGAARPATSDIGAQTVDTNVFAPRLSASYDLSGDGKSLITGSYGRYYASIIQGFSDCVRQRAAAGELRHLSCGTAATYVFSRSRSASAARISRRTSISSPITWTKSRSASSGSSAATWAPASASSRRTWGDLIDDIRTFRADGSIDRQVVNYDAAERSYSGLQLTLERRFSNNWNAQGSYTYSRTEGNHFVDNFTALGDYLDAQCRTTRRSDDRHQWRRSRAPRSTTAPTRPAGPSTIVRTTSS